MAAAAETELHSLICSVLSGEFFSCSVSIAGTRCARLLPDEIRDRKKFRKMFYEARF